MAADSTLLIIGASARAAAFSALRAGLKPWCADLFADADLRRVCPSLLVTDYPRGFAAAFDWAPPGPWIYTGGLENYPDLIDEWATRRPLWGNPGHVLRRVRDPFLVAQALADAGLPCPRLATQPADLLACPRWLVKPRRGSAGHGICFLNPSTTDWPNDRHYVQEFIDGKSYSAVFLAYAEVADLVGVCEQLVGMPWLHAAIFHYAGNISLRKLEYPALSSVADTLVRVVGLRGLFGIDFVVRDGAVLPIEINPRYTASVEVLEHAQGGYALDLHRWAFDPDRSPSARWLTIAPVVGKSIMFAQETLVFPHEGPWQETLRLPFSPTQMSDYADIPVAGQRIEAGQPILTVFAKGKFSAVQDALKERAESLDRHLFGR